MQYLKYQLDVRSPHFLKADRLGYRIEVVENKREAFLSQTKCVMEVSSVEYTRGVLNVDTAQHFALANLLQAIDAELIGSLEEIHCNVKLNINHIRVEYPEVDEVEGDRLQSQKTPVNSENLEN